MNFTDPKFWLEAIVLTLTAINSLVLFLRKPGVDAIAAVTKLRDDMSLFHQTISTEQAVLRERIAHMPTDEELAELAGSVQALSANQKAMNATLSRIEQYLLNSK